MILTGTSRLLGWGLGQTWFILTKIFFKYGLLIAGKDKLVVLWSIQDHITSSASDPATKSPGSGGSIIKKTGDGSDKATDGPSVGPRGIYQGHEDTVEDVAFCPSRYLTWPWLNACSHLIVYCLSIQCIISIFHEIMIFLVIIYIMLLYSVYYANNWKCGCKINLVNMLLYFSLIITLEKHLWYGFLFLIEFICLLKCAGVL